MSPHHYGPVSSSGTEPRHDARPNAAPAPGQRFGVTVSNGAKATLSLVPRRVATLLIGGALAFASGALPVAPAMACDWESYPDFCIPAYPPDLECSQIGAGWFTVNAPDPHSLDGDFDGIGCEG